MSINTTTVDKSGQAYAAYNETGRTEKKKGDYGKTIGNPTLSEDGQKYYEELKKKFGNMDFILVSRDMKESAKAQAASFANPSKTVVLIDEDKVEKMATDKNFRKQYEGIIANASSGLAQLKQSIASSGANVKGYGMQVNDGGNASFFAVLKKSSSAQKERIAKHAEEKKSEKKLAAKKAEKEAAQERLDKTKEDDSSISGKLQGDWTDTEETVTLTASSIEELMRMIDDYTFSERSNNVITEEEQLVGQHIDFRS